MKCCLVLLLFFVAFGSADEKMKGCTPVVCNSGSVSLPVAPDSCGKDQDCRITDESGTVLAKVHEKDENVTIGCDSYVGLCYLMVDDKKLACYNITNETRSTYDGSVEGFNQTTPAPGPSSSNELFHLLWLLLIFPLTGVAVYLWKRRTPRSSATSYKMVPMNGAVPPAAQAQCFLF